MTQLTPPIPLNIDGITSLKTLQCRRGINTDKVMEYSDPLREDASFEFPPIICMKIVKDGRLIIIDGFHRYEAYKIAERTLIPVIHNTGTMEEAMWQAAAANKDHGLPRTMADKRRAVTASLRHGNYTSGAASMRDIARHVGVSHTMVQDVAKKLGLKKQDPEGPVLDPEAKDYPPEVLEAIDKIQTTNPAAADALLTGAILKPFEEIIRYSQYEDDYRAVLAPLFFGRRLSLMASLEIVERKPTDQSTLRDAINFARMQQEDIELAFDNNTVLISVAIFTPVEGQKRLSPTPGTPQFIEP